MSLYNLSDADIEILKTLMFKEAHALYVQSRKPMTAVAERCRLQDRADAITEHLNRVFPEVLEDEDLNVGYTGSVCDIAAD
jgi:hypothetical protein